MKKLTAFILAMLLACTAVVGCEKDEPYETPNDTTQSETLAPTEDVSPKYDQEDLQQGFSIKGKKYYYKGHSDSDQYTEYSEGDVLILTVKNETKIDYKANLQVTFFDENGEKVKTQSKSFDQFIAGYLTYFVFQPKKVFSSYTCELSITELDDIEKSKIIVDKLTLSFEGTRERMMPDMELFESDGVLREIPTLWGQTRIKLNETVPLCDIRYLFILIDNTGEIYMICPFGSATNSLDKTSDHTIYFERDNRSKVNLPVELEGELNYYVFPVSFDYAE